MITRDELLERWEARHDNIYMDGVRLSEEEVYYTSSVLNEIRGEDVNNLSTKQVLERCKSCLSSSVTVGTCATSLKILNRTYKEIL